MKKITFSILVLFSLNSFGQIDAQAQLDNQTAAQLLMDEYQSRMEKSYPGDTPIVDMLEDIFDNSHPENEIKEVSVLIPLVRNSTKVLDDEKFLDSLPMDASKMNEGESTMEMSFVFDEFIKRSKANSRFDFAHHIDKSLEQWKSYDKTPWTCQGASLGTVVKFIDSSNCGRFEYTYTCQFVGAQAKWVYTGFRYIDQWCNIP